jgi:hypothetical protein
MDRLISRIDHLFLTLGQIFSARDDTVLSLVKIPSRLSTIQIATTKWKLASTQSIKAVLMRNMDFLLYSGLESGLNKKRLPIGSR